MVKVLFVCLGNICRSPLAEGIFNHLTAQNGLSNQLSCDSAGTAAGHVGSAPDKRSQKVAKDNGISLSHRARQIQVEDLLAFDYLIAMDNDNFKQIKRLEAKAAEQNLEVKAKVYLMREFDNLYDDEIDDSENDDAWEVADPYYGGREEFEECFDTLDRCNREFIKYLQKAHKL